MLYVVISVIILYVRLAPPGILREMGGAPRNPAPRNHLSMWIAKPSGCHRTDGHLTSGIFTEDQQISSSADPPEEHFPLLRHSASSRVAIPHEAATRSRTVIYMLYLLFMFYSRTVRSRSRGHSETTKRPNTAQHCT